VVFDISNSTLGHVLEYAADVFQYESKFHRIPKEVIDGDRVPTKRDLLGIVMAILDPFGLIADYHISAKILVQNIWSYGTNWDEDIPTELHQNWIYWLS